MEEKRFKEIIVGLQSLLFGARFFLAVLAWWKHTFYGLKK